MSHLLGISGGGVSTDTITADASETMLKVVEGDDIVWKKKRCAIEIDILEKHQGSDMRPVLRIEEVAPGTKVGSYTLVEKLAFDMCTPEKKPDTTVQASKFTLYDPHPILHPSRKGTRLNEPDMFHAPPQESRSEIERAPLLPKLGCSQVSFVAKKQKDIFDAYAVKEKMSTPFLKIPSIRSQMSFADRLRSSRDDNDPYLQPVRTPSLPSQPSHLEQVVMISSTTSQPTAFLRARVSGPAELIPLMPTDDSVWKNMDTHLLTGRAPTSREDIIIGKTSPFKSERPASAPPTSVFSAATPAPQARHYTGDLCGLTDPSQTGDLCGLTDPIQTGDLCGLIDPSPNVAQQAAITTPSQHLPLLENVRSSSVTKIDVVSVNITETVKPTEPLRFPADESVVGIIPGVLLPEQTTYGKRPKISIEELQKPVTKPGFEDSSSEEEQEEDDEVGALPKKESTLGTEAEGSYFADSEMSATPNSAKKQKFDFVKRLFTCAACRSKKKHQLKQDVASSNGPSEKGTSEISSRTGRSNKMSSRSSQMSDPSELSESTQREPSERSDTPAKAKVEEYRVRSLFRTRALLSIFQVSSPVPLLLLPATLH